jgi:putative ABC transport system substrate-binding protein
MSEYIKRISNGQARIPFTADSRSLPLVDQGDRSFLDAVSDCRGFAVKASGTGNIAGVSDMSPIKEQLQLAKQIMPSLKRVGAPYNPGEANSVVLVKLLKQYGEEMGIEIVAPPANGTAFVKNATQSLIGKVDAIFALADNTVTAASATLLQVAGEHNIPVFGNAADSNFDQGTLAALGFSYLSIGRQTGDMVLRLLKGENPGKIDSETTKETTVVINKKLADRLGISIPDSLLKNAAVKVMN